MKPENVFIAALCLLATVLLAFFIVINVYFR